MWDDWRFLLNIFAGDMNSLEKYVSSLYFQLKNLITNFKGHDLHLCNVGNLKLFYDLLWNWSQVKHKAN